MQKVLENILDPNTEALAARKITVNITLKPSDTRDVVGITCVTKTNLAPSKGVKTNVFIGKDKGGQIGLTEIKPKQNYYMEETV
jgi:hypothetical protein